MTELHANPAATTPARERADSRRKRLRLLAAAKELAAQHGWAASAAQIAERAEVGVGTLYRHFGTKEALIDAALNDTRQAAVEALHDALAVEGPDERLRAFLTVVCELQATNRVMSETDPSGRSQVQQITSVQFRNLFAELVADAHRDGVLRADVTWADLAVMTRHAALVGPMPGMTVEPDYWQRLLTVLLDGLRPCSTELPGTPPHPSSHAH